MSRGNDAIPTWSGFNYQGKIMLFYILKLINQINKEEDGRVYSVNLEAIEDFCILRDSEYISFHQVKAWLSVAKWSSYSTAMDKLLKHRNDSSNPIAKCYLMVARDVDDWDEDSNTYNANISVQGATNDIKKCFRYAEWKSQIFRVCGVCRVCQVKCVSFINFPYRQLS